MTIHRHMEKKCWRCDVYSFINFEVIIKKLSVKNKKILYLSDTNFEGILKKLSTQLENS